MKTLKIWKNGAFLEALKGLGKWTLLAGMIGVSCGTASAFFLAALELITLTRETHPKLLFLLPLGGLAVGLLYHIFGKQVEGGNNLIIEEIHEEMQDPKKVIPLRMAPLVLLGTFGTHLFGGSAGREGTAVQMGASIADQFTHLFKIPTTQRKYLLMAGMSGGFGSVFGVPFAGAIFGIEVVSVGRLHFSCLFQCTVAAFVAHFTTLALGIHHIEYPHPIVNSITAQAAFLSILAGITFGLVSRLFSFSTEQIKNISKKLSPYLPFRAFLGGSIISFLFFFLPSTQRYAGLGVSIIEKSLGSLGILNWDWLGKLILTALTLGTGFKGGEVTPLIFIGTTLGNMLSQILPLSLPLLASLGFVGVFAGASNTPFACTIMAIELFGPDVALFATLACFASYAVSGHQGIYESQRIHTKKIRYFLRPFELIQKTCGKNHRR